LTLSVLKIALGTADGESVPISVLWAGAIAVVVAAVITALGVALQTRRTLKSAERQLNRQLAHDRAMRERDELRVLVDEAVARLDLLVLESLEAREIKRRVDTGNSESADVDPTSLDEQLKKVFGGIREIDTLAGRLAVRLGQHHAAVEAYQAAWRSLGNIYEGLIRGEELTDEVFSEAGEHAGKFMRECHKLVGSELEGSSVAS
jgi:hypothetical protein